MTLAERLDWLYRKTGYTYYEMEEATERAGCRVSSSYQSKLRAGKKQRPAYQIVRVLARVFGVPIVFFTDEEVDAEYLSDVEAILLHDDDEARVRVALRSAGRLDEEKRVEIFNETARPSANSV